MFRDFVISSHRDERRHQIGRAGKPLLDRFFRFLFFRHKNRLYGVKQSSRPVEFMTQSHARRTSHCLLKTPEIKPARTGLYYGSRQTDFCPSMTTIRRIGSEIYLTSVIIQSSFSEKSRSSWKFVEVGCVVCHSIPEVRLSTRPADD